MSKATNELGTAVDPSRVDAVILVGGKGTRLRPLTLSAPVSSNPAFAAELSTNQAGKEFQVTIKTVPPLRAGNAQGQITMKSSSTNMPVIHVSVWANVQPVITVVPPQIGLGAAPLANATAAMVSIRNNGTNTLALSEPEIGRAHV